MLEKVVATQVDGPAKFKVTRISGKNSVADLVGAMAYLGHWFTLNVYRPLFWMGVREGPCITRGVV